MSYLMANMRGTKEYYSKLGMDIRSMLNGNSQHIQGSPSRLRYVSRISSVNNIIYTMLCTTQQIYYIVTGCSPAT